MNRPSEKDIQNSLLLFSGLPEEETNRLLQSGSERKLQDGQALFIYGDPVTQFYIITSGAIRLFRSTPDGHEKTVELLKSGQTVGENEIMDACYGYRVNAAAVGDTYVLAFPLSWVKESAKQYPTFALNLLSLISQHVHLAQIEAEHQATMSAAQLVACFLQRLCVLHDLNPAGFELPYSKTLIASRLGMEPETFSRTLAKLKDKGIQTAGTTVSIHDLSRVEEYVCGFCSISDSCPTHQALERKANEH